MARPRLYATDAERLDAKRVAWQKYNKAHKTERAVHNKTYCQRDEVKERRRQLYMAKKVKSVRVNLV